MAFLFSQNLIFFLKTV